MLNMEYSSIIGIYLSIDHGFAEAIQKILQL
mgnify:CR=1 FL=1